MLVEVVGGAHAVVLHPVEGTLDAERPRGRHVELAGALTVVVAVRREPETRVVAVDGEAEYAKLEATDRGGGGEQCGTGKLAVGERGGREWG